MRSDDQLDQRLKHIARQAAPGSSVAPRVMQEIEKLELSPEPSAAAPERTWGFVRVLGGVAAGIVLGIALGYAMPGRGDRASVDPPQGNAVPICVAEINGTVLLKRAAGATWSELTDATPVHVGDMFQASPRSALTLLLDDGSRVVLSANSRLSLEQFDNGVTWSLRAGAMRASLKSPHPPFIVNTPDGQIHALGTNFTVSIE